MADRDRQGCECPQGLDASPLSSSLRLLNYFAIHLDFSLLFSSPSEYIAGQQVVPPHLTWRQWVQLAPTGSFLFFPCSGSLW